MTRQRLSTGLPELDNVFQRLMPGDNIVWQVDSIEDYIPFVEPFARFAQECGKKLIYFRLAEHRPILADTSGAEVHVLQPARGFETFISEIHATIDAAPPGSLYLFDCLSELAADWKSDRMLGNFFMLTCPYLYDRAAIAYFALLRNFHSFHAVEPISSTTQVLVDAYRYEGDIYIHPIKVQGRHSPTMYTLHVRKGDQFEPVTQSAIITEILSHVPWSRMDAASLRLGFWSRTFAEAEVVQARANERENVQNDVDDYFHRILHMLISHHEPVLNLARKYFDLADLLEIRRRMIGTGLIGGKAVGMLLARAVLRREQPALHSLLEMHDSFFVGTDVFYTYLVRNGYWWLVQKSKKEFESGGMGHETVRRRMLTGNFPDYIIAQFSDMLDYFGQSPIIVRSSSPLEDNFGNAFAGKYDSVFCPNQGGRQKRLEDFLDAVRTVYASAMNEEALAYRAKRNLLQLDEQMGVLIQRVSGASYRDLFYPQAAGVGFSFNPYVWNRDIDPQAGMVRLVFGMGTRAVDRSDADYTRVVALNAPLRRPQSSSADELRQYTQRRVDVLDLAANQLCTKYFDDVIQASPELPIEIFASIDPADRFSLHHPKHWLLTFEHLLSKTSFVSDMLAMLETIHRAYDYPVDVEFTVNFFRSPKDKETAYKINIVQCRPLQVSGFGDESFAEIKPEPEKILLESKGPVIGRWVGKRLEWIVYVKPASYSKLGVTDRYTVASVVGELCKHPQIGGKTTMLLGPGRWGTTTPALGVPVSAVDIQTASVLCEIVTMHETLVPDVSLGTHFFNELVENNLLYFAVYPDKPGYRFSEALLNEAPNRLEELLPQYANWLPVVAVISAEDLPEGHLQMSASALRQHVVCWL